MGNTVETGALAATSALELRDVRKTFRKRRGETVNALDSVSLGVGRGETVGILGPNGSGKSTLVRVVSTLVLPDSGTVEVFGLDAVRHPKSVQRNMNRVSVEASKDISYVKFNNGVKYDGLSGTHLTFGIPYGATEVTVKSGTLVKSAHINCPRH